MPPAIKSALKCTAAAALRSGTGKLPFDVMMIQSEFMYYDWAKLLEVFPERESGENQKFCEYVRRCKEAGELVPHRPFGWEWAPITLDRAGNIVELRLFNCKLTDSSIGDLSKLPSTLTTLNVAMNELTKLDVASLPRGLEVLIIGWNPFTELDLSKLPRRLLKLLAERIKLTELDGTQLPPTLTHLFVGHNLLSTINLGELPKEMKFLWMNGNNLREVDLSQLGQSVQMIDLTENYLDDSHFETLDLRRHPDGVQVLGKGEQKA